MSLKILVVLFCLSLNIWGSCVFGQDNSNLSFIENKGQFDHLDNNDQSQILFKLECSTLNLWITESGLTYQMLKFEEVAIENDQTTTDSIRMTCNWERIDLILDGATILKENIKKEFPSSSHNNYFSSKNPEGVYNVQSFKKITIENVYEGIDWVIYLTERGGVKYDFIVRPSGDWKDIQMIYNSKAPVKIDPQGRLEVSTEYGNLYENSPVSFYANRTIKTEFSIAKQKAIKLNGESGFETIVEFVFTDLPKHRTTELTIDPELVWATFVDVSHNTEPKDIHTDFAGNLYTTGLTFAPGFPTFDIGGGAYFSGFTDFADAYLMKFSNNGELLWSTFYGGSNYDYGCALGTDASGNLYFGGNTTSEDFPTMDPGGLSYFDGVKSGFRDIFIMKFDPDGIREWATFYGGVSVEQNPIITVDNSDQLFVALTTWSLDCPSVDAGGAAFFDGVKGGLSDIFLIKFNTSLEREWATYYGGDLGTFDDPRGLCTDPTGNVFVTGVTQCADFPTYSSGGVYEEPHDGFNSCYILKFSNSGERLWATCYGGTSDDLGDDILTNADGDIFVLGKTNSMDFPLLDLGGDAYFDNELDAELDCFVLRFDNDGVHKWGTYFGGDGEELDEAPTVHKANSHAAAINDCGQLYITFQTSSSNLPIMEACEGGYLDSELTASVSGETFDSFLARFSEQGELEWGTYFGGESTDNGASIATDPFGNVFFTSQWNGYTDATLASLPLTDPGGGTFFNDGSLFEGVESTQLGIAKFTIEDSDVEYILTSEDDFACECNGSAAIEVENACPPFTFNWSNGETFVDTLIGASTITELCAGDYWVEVISNCAIPDTLFYTILPSFCGPEIMIENDTICEGECIEIEASIIFADGPVVFDWGADIDSEDSIAILCPGVTTIYEVIANDGFGDDTVYFSIFVKPAPGIDLGPDIIQCEGEAVLDATFPGATYLWQDASDTATYTALESGEYIVEVNLDGCIAIDTVLVSFGYASLDLVNDTTLCEGTEFILIGSLEPLIEHVWQDGSMETTFIASEAGTYSLTITDSLGCTAFDETVLNYSSAIMNFEYSDTIGCQPLTTKLSDLSNILNDEIVGWFWSFGDGNTSFDQNPIHNYLSSGIYDVEFTIYTLTGCEYSVIKSLNILIYEQPIANFTYSPSAPEMNKVVSFTDGSINADSWNWNFDDGSGSALQNPVHIFENIGNFSTKLVVSNLDVCFDSISITINVTEPVIFYVPNVFTPDGDQFNETFFPVFTSGFDPYDYHLTIFNRYGEILFESFNTASGWNGTYGNSGLVPDGVYIWKIDFGASSSDKRQSHTGHVTILK
tara:strand:- start:247 stop:4209 length:3963 start_codon:yes stop_codon:yes gene_type:complete